ncbi:MAG: hypothetical protein COA50_01170 [Flavobacteriaceae bacterium]|nr:MAG: hypothetical protein COA50_01170 [Flavobacteriaceae bacterium]
MAVAFFSHMFFPNREHDISAVKNERNQVTENITNASQAIVQLTADFLQNNIDLPTFEASVKLQNITIGDLELQEQQLTEEFNKMDRRYRKLYFGFPSRRLLFYNIGLGIDFCILALLIINLSFKQKNTTKRLSYGLVGIIGLQIGVYFFVWILYDQQDLSYNIYMCIMVLIAGCAASLGYYLSKIKYEKISVLKSKNTFLQSALDSTFKILGKK